MSLSRFKLPWPNWGFRKYRENNEAIEAAINERTPRQGLGGIKMTEKPDGIVISNEIPTATDDGAGAPGGGGSSLPVALVFNGAAFRVNVVISSTPTPFP